LRVFCDFDGTVAQSDATDVVLERLAGEHWRHIEADWIAGRIDSAECMARQIALVEASESALHAVLDSIELDPGFASFAAWCESAAVPLAIVSDGVDVFIHRILARRGLSRLPVIANRLERVGETRYRLSHPWRSEGCGAGVCKCAVTALREAGAEPSPIMYVGDGRSDFCVSNRVDVLFAKGALAEYARTRQLSHQLYETFWDVAAGLAGLIEPSRARPRETRF
jgi:2,3-diketo-5-methylthio-1-phosphopentane phosphatase